MSQIKNIIENLLKHHERGSKEYLERYIHDILGGKIGQSQAKQYSNMLEDYSSYLSNSNKYDGHYKSLYESLETSDFTTGVSRYIENSGLGSYEDGKDFLNGLNAVEDVLNGGADVDKAIEHYQLPDTDTIEEAIETGVHQYHEPRYDRIIDVEDGYSEEEVKGLTKDNDQ